MQSVHCTSPWELHKPVINVSTACWCSSGAIKELNTSNGTHLFLFLLGLFSPLQLKVTVGNNGLHNNGLRGADTSHISLLQYGVEISRKLHKSLGAPSRHGNREQLLKMFSDKCERMWENHLLGPYCWCSSTICRAPTQAIFFSQLQPW